MVSRPARPEASPPAFVYAALTTKSSMEAEQVSQAARRLVEGTSTLGFEISLFLEHLEEASFLYEQRRDELLDDPELAWTDLDDFEERLEAHVDALMLGEELALAVCRQQAEEGDAGELHAAVRVFCRQGRKDLLDDILALLDGEDEERVLAVRDALRDELPEAWTEEMTRLLRDEAAWRQRIAAHVLGYRRLPAPDALRTALGRAGPEALPEVIRALGRTGVQEARQPLYHEYLRHEAEAVRSEAALALLRLGEQAVMNHLTSSEGGRPWALRFVGLAGAQRQKQQLLEAASSEVAAPESLEALGLLGDVDAVEVLLRHLAVPDVAGAAALGLDLITGAGLTEEVFVPEEVDEDELFEDELERYRRGEPPTGPDGEPLGTTVTRLSQDADAWQGWWAGHRGVFQRGVRYRSGRPCSPAVLVDDLRSGRLPRHVRQLVYEELVIRYGIDAPFETTMWARHQARALTALAARVAAKGSMFREGKWYVGEQLQAADASRAPGRT